MSLVDWVDVFSALLLPVIALLGAYIAWQQWKTNHLRLKHELFDRRYLQFKATNDFLGSIMAKGRVDPELEFEWLQATRGSRFLFDGSVARFFTEIREKSSTLQAIKDELEDVRAGKERTALVARKRAVQDWFRAELEGLEGRFLAYLELKHQ